MSAGNDLLSAPADGLVSLHSVIGAWRRARRLIAVLAVVGIVAGMGLAFGLPHKRSATTALLLQYPSGVDPSQAVQTDLGLLGTRAVARVAEQSLGLNQPIETFAASYHGKVLSDSILEITARAPDSAAAVKRANALARAFLRFRKQTYDYQLKVVESVLGRRRAALQNELADTNRQIQAIDPNAATVEGVPTLSDLLAQREAGQSDIDSVETQIETNVLATATVVDGTHVIDTAAPVSVSKAKILVVDVLTGLVAALALGFGAVTLAAVISTRPVRRADVASALQAPVLVSVGSLRSGGVIELAQRVTGWSAVSAALARRRSDGPDDMTIVVRHLVGLLKSATTTPPALVIVSVGDDGATVAAVDVLTTKLADDGFELSVVNETGRPMKPPTGDDATAPTEAPQRDGVVVLASLTPARGAEHLREWASDAVVVVRSGRASVATLQSTATMIRSAGLTLRSVVLIGSDPHDDSLGVFLARPADETDPAPARPPRRTPKARVK